MEAVYLVYSIMSTVVTSSLLSLLLAFHTLLRFLCRRSLSFPDDKQEPLLLYQGQVRHVRTRPVLHAFRYAVRYALVDLDRTSDTPLPPSFSRSHLSAQEARHVTGTNGPVFLLTIPPSVGYEQNPLSVYYCYDFEGSVAVLKKCIAEVTNTPWGERVSFVFNPDSDSVAKPLHVSPFMDMLGNWRMRASAPGEDLFLEISIQHPVLGNYFTATLEANRVCSSWAYNPALFFWLMPHKVALWIYWQALKLWWKNVAFLNHPKYQNPMYREEALIRDRKLQSSGAIDQKKRNCCNFDDNHLGDASDRTGGDRWCVWRDAEWPWS
ncbi:DUF1365 domain-containing protein [Cinnamomum micranthum f. kanehirae]|uniref:DUF1365 domain-containing protein n=1 Tax=Cinnamomum micranthum f. kanehirae TaxID=337451 RepID=A0A3S3MYQ8_9MAGN|nr:DUF1365 domain-containing protein [Cinnamomum micranthum f. kanehirae]